MTTREEVVERIAYLIIARPAFSNTAEMIYNEVLAPLLAEAAADALNSAAADWPDQGIVSLWLRKRAEGGA